MGVYHIFQRDPSAQTPSCLIVVCYCLILAGDAVCGLEFMWDGSSVGRLVAAFGFFVYFLLFFCWKIS